MRIFHRALLAAKLVLISGSALADTETLEVRTHPALSTVAAHDGHQMRRVAGGSTPQLTVIAHDADGTTADVTRDPGTTSRALGPMIAVTPTGAVHLDNPRIRTAGAIHIAHDGVSKMLGLEILPQ